MIAFSVVIAALGAGVAVSLLVLMFAPVVTVVGYEALGYRHVEEALARMRLAGDDVRGTRPEFDPGRTG